MSGEVLRTIDEEEQKPLVRVLSVFFVRARACVCVCVNECVNSILHVLSAEQRPKYLYDFFSLSRGAFFGK